MSEHLAPIDPKNPGFDPAEPNSRALIIFLAATVVVFVMIVIGVSNFYQVVAEKQEEEAVQSRPSEELKNVRAREDLQLTSYGYISKDKGQVQIPLQRAMELLAREAAEGKLKYSTAPTPVKMEEPQAAAAPAAPAQK